MTDHPEPPAPDTQEETPMSDPTPTDAEMTADIPALLARADLVHLGRQVALVAEGDGFTTEVCGVKIAKCDDRGRTEADIRAEKAEAELAAAREALARVKVVSARLSDEEPQP